MIQSSDKIKRILTMFIGTGLNAILGIISVPIITHIVNPEEYGQVSVLQMYISMFVTLCTLGLEQAYIRFYYVEKSLEYRQELTKKVVGIPIVNALVIVTFIYIFGNQILQISFWNIFLFGICILVTVLENFTRLSIRLEQDTLTYSMILILHRILYAGIAICLIWKYSYQPMSALLLSTFFSLLCPAVIAIAKNKKIWLKKEYKQNTVELNRLLRYSAPFVFSAVANWIFNATDKMALQYFSTYTEIGYYSAAANIVLVISIIQVSFNTVWVPMAVEHFEDNPNEKEFYVVSNDFITLVMAIAATCLITIKSVFGILLGNDYQMATYIFPCLVLQPVMFTISETTVYGINFYKKTKWHAVITVVSCLVNIVGNSLLVPILGGKGAAISTGLSYIVFFILRTVISNRYFKVKFHYIRIAGTVSLLTGYAVINSFFETNLALIVSALCICLVIMVSYRKTIYYIVCLLKNELKKKKQVIT